MRTRFRWTPRAPHLAMAALALFLAAAAVAPLAARAAAPVVEAPQDQAAGHPYLTGVRLLSGETAVYRTGAFPGVPATVVTGTPLGAIINGGSTFFDVAAPEPFRTIVVGVVDTPGYFELRLPSPTRNQRVVITFEQTLPQRLTLRFAVR